MPIKIMEMTVKANVCGADTHRNGQSSTGENSAEDQNNVLIQQAVEQVLEILRQERER